MVEIVGIMAFDSCGRDGATIAVVVPKEIRIIKMKAFHRMHKVSSFVLEPGSRLEVIEHKGLDGFGVNTISESLLVLPKTLRRVDSDGLCANRLFSIISFCGDAKLTNSCELITYQVSPVLQVSSSYSGTSLFGKTALKDDNTISAHCAAMEYKPCYTCFRRKSHNCNITALLLIEIN